LVLRAFKPGDGFSENESGASPEGMKGISGSRCTAIDIPIIHTNFNAAKAGDRVYKVKGIQPFLLSLNFVYFLFTF